jgi:hypothetical protein
MNIGPALFSYLPSAATSRLGIEPSKARFSTFGNIFNFADRPTLESVLGHLVSLEEVLQIDDALLKQTNS